MDTSPFFPTTTNPQGLVIFRVKKIIIPPPKKSHTKVWRIWNEIDCARPHDFWFPSLFTAPRIEHDDSSTPARFNDELISSPQQLLRLPFLQFPPGYFPRHIKYKKKRGGGNIQTPGKFVSNVLFLRIFSHRTENVSSLSQLENSATLSTRNPPRRLWSSRHLHPQ